MSDKYESPDFPIGRPGQPALGIFSQAAEASIAHDQWHADHPGEMCKPGMFADNYEDLDRGEQVLRSIGGSFKAGESFLGRK